MNLSQPAVNPSKIASIEAVRALVADDLESVNAFIRRSLTSEVALINQVSEYIIGSGGKRLRPLIHLLIARAMGYTGDEHIRLAAVIEFIHTATLLHDDVVDESEMRRGRDTANSVWGNAASVLVGDFLYSRAFQMMVDVDRMAVMGILAETTNTIAEGEVMQLLNQGNPDTTEAAYREVIRCKTAKLFEAAGELAGLLTDQHEQATAALGQYGMHLGTAFQLADDVLDYTGSAQSMGKNIGDDLAEGKPTLPLIHVLEKGDEAQRKLVRSVIENGGLEQMNDVLQAIHACDSVEYTYQQALVAANAAKDSLSVVPESDFKDALIFLADFSCQRDD